MTLLSLILLLVKIELVRSSFLSVLGLPDPLKEIDKIIKAVCFICIAAAIIFALYILRTPIKKLFRDVIGSVKNKKLGPKEVVVIVMILIPVVSSEVFIFDNYRGSVGNGEIKLETFKFVDNHVSLSNSNNLKEYTKSRLRELSLKHSGCRGELVYKAGTPLEKTRMALIEYGNKDKLGYILLTGKFLHTYGRNGGESLIYTSLKFYRSSDMDRKNKTVHESIRICIGSSGGVGSLCGMKSATITGRDYIPNNPREISMLRQKFDVSSESNYKLTKFKVITVPCSNIISINYEKDFPRCTDPKLVACYHDGKCLESRMSSNTYTEFLKSSLPEIRTKESLCKSNDCMIGLNTPFTRTSFKKFDKYQPPTEKSFLELVSGTKDSCNIYNSDLSLFDDYKLNKRVHLKRQLGLTDVEIESILKKNVKWTSSDDKPLKQVSEILKFDEQKLRNSTRYRRSSFDPSCLIPIVAIFKNKDCIHHSHRSSIGVEALGKELKLINSKITKEIRNEHEFTKSHIHRIESSNIMVMKELNGKVNEMVKALNENLRLIKDSFESHVLISELDSAWNNIGSFQRDMMTNLKFREFLNRQHRINHELSVLKSIMLYDFSKKCSLNNECRRLLNFLNEEGYGVFYDKDTHVNVNFYEGIEINLIKPIKKEEGVYSLIYKPKIDYSSNCVKLYNVFKCKYCYKQEYEEIKDFTKFNSHKIEKMQFKSSLEFHECISDHEDQDLEFQVKENCFILNTTGVWMNKGTCGLSKAESVLTEELDALENSKMNFTIVYGIKQNNFLESELEKSEAEYDVKSKENTDRSKKMIDESISNLVMWNHVVHSNTLYLWIMCVSGIVVIFILIYRMYLMDFKLKSLEQTIAKNVEHEMDVYRLEFEDQRFLVKNCSVFNVGVEVESGIIVDSKFKVMIGMKLIEKFSSVCEEESHINCMMSKADSEWKEMRKVQSIEQKTIIRIRKLKISQESGKLISKPNEARMNNKKSTEEGLPRAIVNPSSEIKTENFHVQIGNKVNHETIPLYTSNIYPTAPKECLY